MICAPGRAHLLGGGSPLRTRQGEPLAERQGCRGRLRIRRKPKAKRWPDEQEADEAAQRGETGNIVKARYLHGTLRRRSDRHKREGECAIPWEIWLAAPRGLPPSRGAGTVGQKSAAGHLRPGRNAWQAVQAARDYVRGGRGWVVDIDLAKFFDRVNHDLLMARVARQVGDTRVLGLIRWFLQAGLMQGGLCGKDERARRKAGAVAAAIEHHADGP